ncbi:hypothetical protein M8C21_013438, partial [Ambrosia artemisiifolia]
IFKWHAPPKNKDVVIGHDCLIEQDSSDTIVFMIASRMELGTQKECIWNIIVGIGNVFHGKRSRSNVPCCTQTHMDAHLLLVL